MTTNSLRTKKKARPDYSRAGELPRERQEEELGDWRGESLRGRPFVGGEMVSKKLHAADARISDLSASHFCKPRVSGSGGVAYRLPVALSGL